MLVEAGNDRYNYTSNYSFSIILYPEGSVSNVTKWEADYIDSNGVVRAWDYSTVQNKDMYTFSGSVPIIMDLGPTSNLNDSDYVRLANQKNYTLTCNVGSCVLSSVSLNGKSLFNLSWWKRSELIRYGFSDGSHFCPTVDLNFQFSYSKIGLNTELRQNPITITFNFSNTFEVSIANESDYNSNAGTVVTDPQIHNDLSNLNDSTNAIEESVTSDTGGGILATIKNFFGGFFSNLINSILGLFVPSSDYFSTWFSNLNTLLSDKLGMLYAPFDLLISTLNAIYSADTSEPGIVFPGFDWDGETVIEPYTFYFSSLGEKFQNLRDAVYFATDVVLLFAFLHLLQKKIALVITGSEVNG